MEATKTIINEVKLLTALKILHEENKKRPAGEYNSGYAKALYDILQAINLCKD